MRTSKHPPLSEDTKTRIIERWRHGKLNQVTVIAKEFNCDPSQVNTLINNYLTQKIHFR